MVNCSTARHFNYVMLSPIGDPARSKVLQLRAARAPLKPTRPSSSSPNLPAAHADLFPLSRSSSKTRPEESPTTATPPTRTPTSNQDQPTTNPNQDGAQAVQGPATRRRQNPRTAPARTPPAATAGDPTTASPQGAQPQADNSRGRPRWRGRPPPRGLRQKLAARAAGQSST